MSVLIELLCDGLNLAEGFFPVLARGPRWNPQNVTPLAIHRKPNPGTERLAADVTSGFIRMGIAQDRAAMLWPAVDSLLNRIPSVENGFKDGWAPSCFHENHATDLIPI